MTAIHADSNGVKLGHLQRFQSLDPQAFAALMRHLGFAAAACYRRRGEVWVLLLSGEPEGTWPAAVTHSFHYSSEEASGDPLGWVNAKVSRTASGDWPKGANLYFPEQSLDDEELLFSVLTPPGKRLRGGELSAPLEVLCARIKTMLRAADERRSLTDQGLVEHIKSLGIDLHMLLDHELRTPLQSVSGYASLLRETDPSTQPAAWQEYWRIVDAELQRALETIGKLTLALPGAEPGAGDTREPFDAADEVLSLCEEARERARDLIGEEQAQKLSLKVSKNSDVSLSLLGERRLFRWATWEVIKNAIVHSRLGRVEVAVYTQGQMVVVDILDDGPGVGQGSEELIFLRFYQEPSQAARRARKGLGLGLYLARHITERHLGQLTYVRGRGGSVFRFLWPLATAAWRAGA